VKKGIKFSNLIRGDSFLQTNYFKGYKYIDKAGELINIYVTKKNPLVNARVGINGLVISKPQTNIEELKISHQFFWMRFTDTSLDLKTFKRIYSDELKKINKTINFEYITRIGWRNYLIYEFIKENQKEKTYKKLNFIANTETDNVKLIIKDDLNIKASLTLQKVKRTDDEKKFALLFDLDIFSEGEFKENGFDEITDNFYNFMNSKFLDVVNELIK